MQTEDKLNKLYGLQQALKARQYEKEQLIESVIPDDIKKKIKDIETEYAGNALLATQIEALESEIRLEVIERGERAVGKYLMVTYSAGRVSWDSKALDVYAIDHPEILCFRTVGAPSTSLRKVG